MNNCIKILINKFYGSIEYKIISIFIFIALIISVSVFNNDTTYFEVLGYSLTYTNILVLIIYPCFLFGYLSIFRIINKNQSLILRMSNKGKYYKMIIKLVVELTTLLFIQYVLTGIVCTNLFKNTGFIITNNLQYQVNDVVVFILAIIKLYLSFIIVGLLNTLMSIKFSINISAFTSVLYIVVLYITSDLLLPCYLNIINPGFNAFGFIYDTNFVYLILSGIIFYAFSYLILLLFIKKCINTADIGVDNDENFKKKFNFIKK